MMNTVILVSCIVVGIVLIGNLGCKISDWSKERRRNSAPSVNRRSVLVENGTRNEGTGRVIYFANDTHNSKDREYHFQYRYVYDNLLNSHTWRAYILRMPSLRGRDGVYTHRWHNSNGDFWVCWDTPINTLKDMQTVSKHWADYVQEYIATGKTFG